MYETVVRYERFFNHEPQHIPDILVTFLDDRGLRHRHPTVRSRSAYLFTRFIKSLKHHLSNFTEEILKRIQDLLIIVLPVSWSRILYEPLLLQAFYFHELCKSLQGHEFNSTWKRSELVVLVPVIRKNIDQKMSADKVHWVI